MNDYVFIANNLCFSQNGESIFENFNISIKHGEIVSIIGANKCGKSTLIKLLSGFYPTENKIAVSNIVLNEKSKEGFYKKVGLVCNENNRENHALVGDYISSDAKRKNNNFYRKIIEMFGIQELLKQRVNTLGVDDFIRVEMCKNLVKKPNVLFIDYTNIHMSQALKKQISFLYELLAKEDIAIVFATNDPTDALIADTTYVIHKGVIALAGKTKDVFRQDSLLLKLGIELPFEVDLSLKLGMYGLLDDIYYDIDELVNRLWK